MQSLRPIPLRPIGVRSGHDQDVCSFISGVHRRLDAGESLLAVDGLLAAGVTAALGGHLVFDHDACKAGLRIAANRPLDVNGIAVTSIAVAKHGDRNRAAYVPPLI